MGDPGRQVLLTIMKVTFVCTGNTCRSALAHHLMEKLLKEGGVSGVEVDSFGTYGGEELAVPQVVYELLRREGVSSVRHRSKGMAPSLVESSDLLLVMQQGHRDILLEQFPKAKDKVHLLRAYAGCQENPEIPDPIGATRETYEQCLRSIKEALLKLVQRFQNSGR